MSFRGEAQTHITILQRENEETSIDLFLLNDRYVDVKNITTSSHSINVVFTALLFLLHMKVKVVKKVKVI